MPAQILHLHTYFLFPFWIDREAISRPDEDVKRAPTWIHRLDQHVSVCSAPERCGSIQRLGTWQRAAYVRADLDSQAYQDMIFFHPFVRRIFFDTGESQMRKDREPLIRCYRIPIEDGRQVHLKAEDARGRCAAMQVTDLRLFLFANGMGILSIGCEARNISQRDALWVNEQMRKVYPSSGRQLREGRAPNRYFLTLEENGKEELIVEERFEGARMLGFQPPLSKIIRSLLYFLDYEKHQYEQLLDERMIVYSYAAIDPASVPADFTRSEAYEVLLSLFLYVDHDAPTYRYQPEFTGKQMEGHVYRRWAHEGTCYGFTSYSNVTLAMGEFDRGEHMAAEGFLIHRMFDTRYYLMAIIALFYRATLLDFEQKVALVSRRLFRDQETGTISRENLEIASTLRAEFLHFSNYWFFDELANKDEEIEHFAMQCRNYRIGEMKREIEQEIEKLNASLHDYHQNRSTEAVNRLAVLSIVFGFGAVVTGFFGMNFGGMFGKTFFEPNGSGFVVHYAAVGLVTLLALGAVAFGVYLIAVNRADYRDILVPGKKKPRRRLRWFTLKKSE
jgi:hypothetical protein